MPATSIASIESDQVIGGFFSASGVESAGGDGGAGSEGRELSATHPVDTITTNMSDPILFFSNVVNAKSG
jgi:hypothetical protein